MLGFSLREFHIDIFSVPARLGEIKKQRSLVNSLQLRLVST